MSPHIFCVGCSSIESFFLGGAREFCVRVYQHDDRADARSKETPEEYRLKRIGRLRMWAGNKTRWAFGPYVAEAKMFLTTDEHR